MPINIEVFLSSPHLATNISTLKKEDLISLAHHFEITVNPQMKKNEIKKLIVAKLVKNGLINGKEAYQPQHFATQNQSTKLTNQSQSESHFQPVLTHKNNGENGQIDIMEKKTGSTSCAYCKKPGHHISQCRKKACNDSHPLGFVSKNKTDSDSFNTFVMKKSRNKVMETFKPYLSEGFCSVDR